MSLDHTINTLLSLEKSDPAHKEDLHITIQSLGLNTISYPIILIGGTNGKGSVCGYLSTILSNSGYKVGLFTSPHVLKYNERIQINNQAITDNELNSALERVLQNYPGPANTLGLFKVFTLASHLIFKETNIDIAIYEVGIGGRHDITNLFEPTISAITNIDFDHKDILGSTIEAITYQKSGIFREHKPAFFGDYNIPPTLVNEAQKIGANLQILGQDFTVEETPNSFHVRCANKNYFSLPCPSLRGIKQTQNAAIAIAILDQLTHSFPLSLQQIKLGLLQTALLGRFQVLPGIPQTILDVAHNPHAVAHMLQNMLKLPPPTTRIAIFGVATDKDVQSIIFMCKEHFAKWFIAPIKSAKALSTNTIATLLFANGIPEEQIIVLDNIANAYKKAQSEANDSTQIIAFGSFLVVEEIYNYLENN